MNTILTGRTRSVGARATLVTVAALVLGIAALAALEAATTMPDSGVFAWVGAYLTEVGDALGRE